MTTTTATSGTVTLNGDRLRVEDLEVIDADIGQFVDQTPEPDRPRLVSDGLRVGLLAMRNVGLTVNVDFIGREFDQLLARLNNANEQAEVALEDTLRANFADGDGRLPRILEEFLGDRGKLRVFVTELFDDNRRDSATGRLREMLGRYFDGDGAVLATMLDPTRLGSPLYQFRGEMTSGFKDLGERLAALEAAATARAAERLRGTAKGTDFEDLMEEPLGVIARGAGDLLERTSTVEGAILGCKKGDFVLTLDPSRTGTDPLRIVIECKNGRVRARKLAEEVAEAKENRQASVALVILEPDQAPKGISPLQIVGEDVYCVIGDDADFAVLELAVRLARLLAFVELRDRSRPIDVAIIQPAVLEIREELKAFKTVKSTLTSMERSVSDGASSIVVQLERTRQRVLSLVEQIEEAVTQTAEPEALSA